MHRRPVLLTTVVLMGSLACSRPQSVRAEKLPSGNIFQKLNLHSGAELILYAVRKGVIS